MKSVGVVTLPFARHVIDVLVAGVNMQIQRVDAFFNAVGRVVVGVVCGVISRRRIDRQVEAVILVTHPFADGVVKYKILRHGVLDKSH